MKAKTTLKLLSWPFFMFPIFNYAQSAIVTTGNEIKTVTGSVSYSVGQIANKNKDAASGKITEGVQQPYEITTLRTSESSPTKNITIYPNPVKDMLQIDFNNEEFKNSNYQLFNAQGQLINSGKISAQKTEINFSTYPTSIYILKIEDNSKVNKSFKIIKK